MLNYKIQHKLNEVKNNCLVFDIETSSHYPDGREINIRSDFDNYVALAKTKWFGGYSYKYKQGFYLNAITERNKIEQLLRDHTVLVSFNGEDFDYPILVNNQFTSKFNRYLNVDVLQILGTSNQKNKKGYPYKNRGKLMKYEFKRNNLKCIAETMKLEVQKGEIDYSIFHKDEWTDEEIVEIKKYLSDDVMATKEMFDELWNYWMPFTELLDEKSILDLSWIRSSIASLTYKSACYFMGVEPTYSEIESEKKDSGGRVIEPTQEETVNGWYIDVTSLYPHIFSMFNLFAETNDKTAWHGNEMFKVKGYYDISKWHIMSQKIAERLKQRIKLKKEDPENSMIYSLKIFLNGLFGIVYSPRFEKIYSPNAGWDCCSIGRQIHAYMEKRMKDFGFYSIGGDTDGLTVKAEDDEFNDRNYVEDCLKKIVKEILKNIPFPVETFNIDIECNFDYLLYPFSLQELVDEKTRKLLNKKMIEGYEEKTIDKKKCIIETSLGKIVKKGRSWIKKLKGRKKNYLIIHTKNGKKEIELVGLPIKKNNATVLGIKIYEEVLKDKILKNNSAKFTQEFIDNTLNKYLENPEIMKLMAREYRVKPYNTYKIPKGKTEPTGIYPQLSRVYFNDGEGIISVIANNRIGKVGKGKKYCSIQEAIDNKLKVDDLDLEKINNELGAFVLTTE